jgi:hypothetical protein
MMTSRRNYFMCFRRVKQKSGISHILNHFDGLDWEYLKNAFYLKYYSPCKDYCDRSHIFHFLPHPGESIAETWRLMGFLSRTLANHGFSKGILLLNFYVRLDRCHKEFLDNSREGSFTHKVDDEACELLEKISEN